MHAVALLDGLVGDQHAVRGAVGDRQRSRVLEAHAVRHRDKLVGGDQAVFRHAAVEHLAHQAFLLVERIDQHAVAGLPLRHARADLGDLAGHVEADDHRQRHLDAGHAFDGEHVVVVERRGAHADDHVAFGRLRDRVVADDLKSSSVPCLRSTSAFIVLLGPRPSSCASPLAGSHAWRRLALDTIRHGRDAAQSRPPLPSPVDLVEPWDSAHPTVSGRTTLGRARDRPDAGEAFQVKTVSSDGVLVDCVGAPGVMRVRRAELARAPDDRQDRKMPVRIVWRITRRAWQLGLRRTLRRLQQLRHCRGAGNGRADHAWRIVTGSSQAPLTGRQPSDCSRVARSRRSGGENSRGRRWRHPKYLTHSRPDRPSRSETRATPKRRLERIDSRR